MHFAKAHGLGNDFILVPEAEAPADTAGWARRLCDRHEGIGGDGVLVYGLEPDSVRMRLVNADGSDGEVSGNGVRCLAAFAAGRRGLSARHVVVTPVGPRTVWWPTWATAAIACAPGSARPSSRATASRWRSSRRNPAWWSIRSRARAAR
jgi:diaminopimelate epimerase